MSGLPVAVDRSIAFFHKDLGPHDKGGISVLFKRYAQALVKDGWQVYTVSPYDPRIPGVTAVPVPEIKDPWLYSATVAACTDRIPARIYECSNWRFELLEYARKNRCGAKVVVRCDPSAITLFENTNYDNSESELCNRADVCIGVSEFATDDVRNRYGVQRMVCIPNGIPVSDPTLMVRPDISSGYALKAAPCSFERTARVSMPIADLFSEKKINVYWVGKPTKMKGFDFLQNLLRNVSREEFQFILNIGHAVPQFQIDVASLQQCFILQDLDREDHVSLYRSADVLLMTSRVEGFCQALGEALAEGCPVVANRNCAVVREYMPSAAMSLVAVEDHEDVVSAIRNQKSRRFSCSMLPPHFELERAMIKNIALYESLLT